MELKTKEVYMCWRKPKASTPMVVYPNLFNIGNFYDVEESKEGLFALVEGERYKINESMLNNHFSKVWNKFK